MSSGLIALNLMLHFIERIKSNAFFLIIIKYNAKCIKYNANEFAVWHCQLWCGARKPRAGIAAGHYPSSS